MPSNPEPTPSPADASKGRSPLRRVASVFIPKPAKPIDPETCSICDYSLEGLAPWWVRDACCPECGSNMTLARLGSDLANEDPRALRRLTLGLGSLSASIAVTIVAPIFTMLIMLAISTAIVSLWTNTPVPGIIERVGGILLVAAPVIGGVLWCIAWLQIASATQNARISPGRRTTRAVLRIALIVSVAAVVASIILATLGPGLIMARDLALTVAAACTYIAAGAGLVLLRALAKRTTDKSTRRSITQVLAISPLLVAGAIWVGYAQIAGLRDQQTPSGFLFLFTFFWALATLSSASRLARSVRAARDAQNDRPRSPAADPPPAGTLRQDAG